MPDTEVEFLNQSTGVFCCPRCGGELIGGSERIDCRACAISFGVVDGIPMLFCPNDWDSSREDVTNEIQSFYEKHPFPNYDDFDSVASLVDKSKAGVAGMLDDQVPFGTRILECGCGTGQLTNFLSIASRTVIGTDICLNSLRMAREFKVRSGLTRSQFYQMNLFRPCFKPASFDLVISNGVLHHTSDPALAFRSIAGLVKPGGYIMIGLYHAYGRILTDLRRLIFNVTKDRFTFLDRRAVDAKSSVGKRVSWFMDQYKNPHESKHTVGEVLGWLDEAGFTFVHSLPKTVPFERTAHSERLFKPDKLGNRLQRFLVDIGMTFTGYREGGFFVVIAKKDLTAGVSVHSG